MKDAGFAIPVDAPEVTALPEDLSSFSISALPGTDYWRKPPAVDAHNAPAILKSIRISDFHRARVTVGALWNRLYDQGGIFIKFPTYVAGDKQCWLKTGIEFYNDSTNLSTVPAREWADWSLLPLQASGATIEIEREPVNAKEGTGSSLWVYLIGNAGKTKTAVREVTWAFEKDEGEIQIGVYAARPTASEGEVAGESGEPLRVFFSSLVIE